MNNTLLTGPMFSGKTRTLVTMLEKYVLAKQDVVWFEPVKDDRGGSHGNFIAQRMEELKNSPYVHSTQIQLPSDIFTYLKKHSHIKVNAIFIDEFFMIPFERQFFYDFQKSEFKDIPMVFAGLISSWSSQLFPAATEIIPFMDVIKKDVAVCMKCGKPANYSYFNGDWEDSKTAIDHGQYECLCAECYIGTTKKPVTVALKL